MCIMQSNERRRFCSFSTVFDGFQSRRKKLELWGLVFSGLWPRYGFSIPMVSYHRTVGRVFFPKTSVTIVILFWLKWAGYLAVAGLNLLAQLSDRISPYGV